MSVLFLQREICITVVLNKSPHPEVGIECLLKYLSYLTYASVPECGGVVLSSSVIIPSDTG